MSRPKHITYGPPTHRSTIDPPGFSATDTDPDPFRAGFTQESLNLFVRSIVDAHERSRSADIPTRGLSSPSRYTSTDEFGISTKDTRSNVFGTNSNHYMSGALPRTSNTPRTTVKPTVESSSPSGITYEEDGLPDYLFDDPSLRADTVKQISANPPVMSDLEHTLCSQARSLSLGRSWTDIDQKTREWAKEVTTTPLERSRMAEWSRVNPHMVANDFDDWYHSKYR